MALKHRKIILFGLMAFCGAVAEGVPVVVQLCTDEPIHANNISVDISPCPEQPCVFKKGTTVNCTITFTPTENVQSGELQIYGIIAGSKLPFPLPQPNPCMDHGLVCPLTEEVPVVLDISLPIESFYPEIELIAMFDMRDQDIKYVFCFELAVKIAPAISEPEDVQL